MNCDDYLSMLATLPVDELADGRAREHADTCPECNRVTRVVVARERSMLAVYGELPMAATAPEVAARALRTSRHRTVSLYYRIGLGLSAAAALLYAVYARRDSATPPVPTVRETIRLQCLSPEQAAEVLRPYLHRTGSITIRPTPLGLIHVEATAKDMTTAHKILERFDNPAASQCAVQVKLPPVR
jgi:hypothetical protein